MLSLKYVFISCIASIPMLVKCALQIQTSTEKDFVTNKYLVILRPQVGLANHMNVLHRQMGDGRATYGILLHNFTIGNFNAYSGHFDSGFIEQLVTHGDIARIEADQIVGTNSVTQTDAPRGLNVISHRRFSSDYDYVYDNAAGRGTYAYVLDSGINTQHKEFEGRATSGYVAEGLQPGDVSGHGSHVAGIIGSKTYGVAKKTRLISVKVLDHTLGSSSTLLEGFEWAYRDIKDKRLQAKAVINISVAGGIPKSINEAIDEAFANGISTVVAAGNYAEDVEIEWSTTGAIIVAATDLYNNRARFSSYGSAVTLFAPGVKIQSCWRGGPDAVRTESGTSQAAGFVTGVVALLKSRLKLPGAMVTRGVVQGLATRGIVKDLRGSPNLFLYNGGGR
ncbi:hypothetical protein ANO11243_071450 [Dothideomycetidae sp. 11243]|nr:hypothetical protein ANO11243_071450 [fungal sp. No.11243]